MTREELAHPTSSSGNGAGHKGDHRRKQGIVDFAGRDILAVDYAQEWSRDHSVKGSSLLLNENGPVEGKSQHLSKHESKKELTLWILSLHYLGFS